MVKHSKSYESFFKTRRFDIKLNDGVGLCSCSRYQLSTCAMESQLIGLEASSRFEQLELAGKRSVLQLEFEFYHSVLENLIDNASFT